MTKICNAGILIVVSLAVIGIHSYRCPLIAWFTELDEIVIAAIITVVGVMMTAIVSLAVKRLENKHAIEAQFRKDRTDLYIRFMEEFDSLMSSSPRRKRRPDHLVNVLKDFQRKTTVWGSEEMMSKFGQLKDTSSRFSDDRTVNGLGTTLRAYGELVLTMRKDVGLSNRGIDEKTFGARLVLRNPDFLLSFMKTNPSMSVAELTRIEEEKSC